MGERRDPGYLTGQMLLWGVAIGSVGAVAGMFVVAETLRRAGRLLIR